MSAVAGFVFPLVMAGADTAERLRSVRVSPEGAFAGIGSYDVSPESPDGTKILYARWTRSPKDGGGGAGSIWYCRRDLSGHTKIIDYKNLWVHNAGGIAWLDNERIQVAACFDGKQTASAIVNINGTVEFGPYRGMELLHEPVKGKVLLYGQGDRSQFGRGLFVLDTATGKISKVCDERDFVKYAAKMPDMKDPAYWVITHPTWSKDGSYIALCLQSNKPKAPIGEYLFSFRPDFTDVVFFGKKPMHFNWYDDHQSIFGNDRAVQDGLENDNSIRRWTRDGKWIETLAGAATHNTMSPDKRWFAGESWYNTDPVLTLYRTGSTNATATVMAHRFRNVTWDMRAHVNPAFSRDSKRLYYNRATSESLNEVWVADLPGL
jgi:hypothetical protein